jgi:hypothetical protein
MITGRNLRFLRTDDDDEVGLSGRDLRPIYPDAGNGSWLRPEQELEPQLHRATFAGQRSATAPMDELRRAQEQDPSDRDKIWVDTGWMQGDDDVWRYEIDDSQAKLKSLVPPYSSNQSRRSTLGQLLDHPELFKAYPQLQDLAVDLQSGPIGVAQFAGHLNRADQNADGKPLMSLSMRQSPHELLKTLLHEGQHAIEDIEGFDYQGGNVDYWRMPGEIQARNVEARQHLSPTERRAMAPWSTDDSETILPNDLSESDAWEVLGGPGGGAMPSDPAALGAKFRETWAENPSDALGRAIEVLAKKFGIKPPWEDAR